MGIAPLPTHDVIWLRKRRKIFVLTRASSSARAHDGEEESEREMGKIDKLEMQRKTHCQCARWWWEQVAASSSAQRTLGCSGWVWLTNSILLFEGLWPLPQLNFFRRISSASYSGILHFANWTRVKWEKNLNIDRRRWRGKKCVYMKILYQLTITYFLDYSSDVAAVHMILTSQWTNTTWYMYAMVRAPEFTILLNNV